LVCQEIEPKGHALSKYKSQATREYKKANSKTNPLDSKKHVHSTRALYYVQQP